MKVVIIEDEVKTARDLEQSLKRADPDIEVIRLIDSVESGIAYFRDNPTPDLIYSDIQISDGLSFEIFKELKVYPPVIFCTAYNEYALEAFRSNGIDYILKPFDEESISSSLNKFKTLRGNYNEDETSKLLKLLEQLAEPRKHSLLISFRDKIFPVKVESIAYFYVANETTMLYTDGNLYPVQYSLEVLENMLDPKLFFRVNRQYLVNRSFIMEAEQYFARKLAVKLSVSVKENITVSKAKSAQFLLWLEQ